MLTLKQLRDDKQAAITRLAKKGVDAAPIIEKIEQADDRRKAIQAELDNCLAQQNAAAKQIGMLIGQGVPVNEATKQVGMVVEGLNALPAAMKLAGKYGVEMPIVETVDSVVSGRANVSTAIDLLMSRELKSEIIK